jgi:hypothetical protein
MLSIQKLLLLEEEGDSVEKLRIRGFELFCLVSEQTSGRTSCPSSGARGYGARAPVETVRNTSASMILELA